jgi:hypothetical protein
MWLRLSMQPFWVRALSYGVSFGVFFGLYSCLLWPSGGLGTVISSLVAGVGFGLAMAFQGQTMYAELTEAVAGLDETKRAEAFAAVSGGGGGGVPADSAVRNAAIRLGKTLLRRKTDAQLKRQEWWTWLLMVFSVGLATFLASTSRSRYEAAVAVVLALVCLIVMPLGVVRQRRIQRNVALLSEGAVPRR